MKNEGYKQTEIGLIPENWEVSFLGNLCVPSKKRVFASSLNDDTPCIELEHISVGTGRILGSTPAKSVISQKAIFEPGDVLFGKLRPYLRKFLLPKDNGICSTEIWVLKKGKTITSHYLYYTVQSERVISSAMISIGTKMPRAEWTVVSKTQIPLPPLSEQAAIAEALTDMDALIAHTEQLIEKKKAIKKGVMQELLRPKEGWVKVKVGNTIKVSRGGSPRPIQDYLTNDPNGINWIKIGDTRPKSRFIDSTNEKIVAEGIRNSRVVFEGDLLLSNSMSFGRPYILRIGGCIHDGWLVLQDYQTDFNREFLYYSLTSTFVLNQYLNMAAGSSVLNLNKEIVKNVILYKPSSIKEQEDIANSLSALDEQTELLETKLQKLKLQKLGMMQALLTGKIRLV